MKKTIRGLCFIIAALSSAEAQEPTTPITDQVWQEAVISVTDLDRTAEFFVEIGGFETKWRGQMDPTEIAAWDLGTKASAEALLLGPQGEDTGLIRLVRFDDAGRKMPTRPGSRAWDTGCFFSLMVRMKDMPSIFDDAIRMGWWTETPMTYLEFGESKLNVMIFRGPDGVQVQGYERLSPPLPDAIPAFERMTRPFNIMQMVRDRDASYSFFTEMLGFETFYKGSPFVSPEPEFMPLGIPKNLTTEVRYRAGIVHPVPGEFGRMEMIEIMDLDGRDFAANCVAPNLGILAVRFPVADTRDALYTIVERGGRIELFASGVVIEPYGELRLFNVKTPDGANVHFYETLKPSQ
ncbi:MAG: hypothetical protein QNJ07_12700 [Woeseiaceae bacterium]|nr:hypothetical protein [Woeseiaceae bacterium]